MSENKIEISVMGLVEGYAVTLRMEVLPDRVAESLGNLLNQLRDQGGTAVQTHTETGRQEREQTADGPINRLAAELEMAGSALKTHVGFKDKTVQITKASQIMVTDALTMIIFSVEKGLGQPSLTVEDMQNLIGLNGVKYEYPTTTAIFNLKKAGYINASLYDQEQKLSLTPRGENNARKAFKALIEGAAPKRKIRARSKKSKK